MAKKFDKDRWILHMLKHRYIIAKEDGTILRATRATVKGEILSDSVYVPIKPRIHKATGRVYCNISWMGIKKSVLVNRVIALRFLPNPLNLPQVNHIDGDKENNALSNLEWSSGADNERHAHRNGLKSGRGSQNANAKLNADDVLSIREMSSAGISVAKIAETFGIGRSTAINVIKRKTWMHI